ncbi:MAG: hypothetical protein DHS20C16_25100 [Phycisphaerae bacterium]|nr:MAG: hypothetical protein DHS20C16_25100 [Phycisphaerae bacterium]
MTVKTQQLLKVNGKNGLPDPLQTIVERVVRSARLWPSERRDVRAELESHFHEGMREMLDDGIAPDESIEMLHDAFGDPTLAAQLIGRSKRKGRPMIWKVTIAAMLTLATGTVLAGGFAAYLFLGEPTPSVDYVEKINERVKQTPEEDRAWPVLRDALLKFKSQPESVGKPLPFPGDASWTDAVAWVNANEALIPTIEEAANKKSYGFIYDNRVNVEFMRQRAILSGEDAPQLDAEPDPMMPPTLAILLPNLGEMRSLARMMVIDARMHLQNDDFEQAFRSLDTAHRLGALLMYGETTIDQLVGRAIIDLATSEMLTTIYDRRDSLTEDDLNVIASSHFLTMDPDVIRPRFDGEQVMFQDVVQYVFTDDGKGSGRPIPSQFVKVCSMWMNGNEGDLEFLAKAANHADRRKTLEQYAKLWDQMTELRELPLYDARRETTGEVLETFNKNPETRNRFALISSALPNLSRADQLIREGAMMARAVKVIHAILEFESKRGELPARLGSLDAKPDATDAYSGLNLRYRMLDDGEFTLYSVGHNLVDDRGQNATLEQPDDDSAEDDIVYWPR